MWADHLPKLTEKFHELRAATTESGSNSSLSPVYQRYDDLSFEMVEGIQSLLIPLIEDQIYIRKVYPHMDQAIFREMHVTMMERVQEALDPEVQSLPEFYYRLIGVVEQMDSYCVLLKQDIMEAFRRYAGLKKDRKFRQINLQIKQTRESIARLKRRCAALSRLIGGSQSNQAMETVLQTDGSKAEIMELLASGQFSEDELEQLKDLLEIG